jgi:hypothetical protein
MALHAIQNVCAVAVRKGGGLPEMFKYANALMQMD